MCFISSVMKNQRENKLSAICIECNLICVTWLLTSKFNILNIVGSFLETCIKFRFFSIKSAIYCVYAH